MGVMQSAASLGRAVGPALTGFLLSAAVVAENVASIENVSNFTIMRTFWTASAIMVPALLFAIYFAYKHKDQPLVPA